jgi:enoyl-CoA hydratase
MNPEMTLLEQRESVATLSLNRAAKRNALSRALRTEIVARLKALKENDAVSAVILTGEGDVFCAGFDRSEFGEEEMTKIFSESLDYHRQVYTFPKPIIAAVNGPALGGGCDLAALCDIRLASTTASFGQPQVRFGAAAAYELMREVMSEGAAREMCLSGRLYGAQEAREMGFINAVHEPENLMRRAEELAAAIATLPQPMPRKTKQQFLVRQPDLFQP